MGVTFNRAGGEIVCANCGRGGLIVSRALGVCLDCLRGDFDRVRARVEAAHRRAREAFDLPPVPPREEAGLPCPLCANACRIPQEGSGYCGVRFNRGGRVVGGEREARVDWYDDPLPTNCVADWVCPGGSGAGYPTFAHRPGPEYGYKNLAVFYNSCTFDCLFCQNWHYRLGARRRWGVSVAQLADQVDERTSCICYFGGDPTPQLHHALAVARRALRRRRGGILRICWETNGAMHRTLLERMVELSLRSGGCVKFDLKAWDDGVHRALCGVSNKQTLENFAWVAGRARERPRPPLLVASTLLVPGYIDAEEVGRIAAFIADLDPDIPYALLAFHPCFYMRDLPTTSRRQARECLEAARAAGLRRVRLGNIHLLGDE